MKRLVCRVRGHDPRYRMVTRPRRLGSDELVVETVDDYGYPGHRPWTCARCGAECCSMGGAA